MNAPTENFCKTNRLSKTKTEFHPQPMQGQRLKPLDGLPSTGATSTALPNSNHLLELAQELAHRETAEAKLKERKTLFEKIKTKIFAL
tara:strand:- start:758 stop:1021 length:264 start_codon:yes stop_codon:yes gene_type:complete